MLVGKLDIKFSRYMAILILSPCDSVQVSAGYFLSDLGMICWFYPSLGGLEYVSIYSPVEENFVNHRYLFQEILHLASIYMLYVKF